MKKLNTILATALIPLFLVAIIPAVTVKAATPLWTGVVSSDGTPITTPFVLAAGALYHISVSGHWCYDTELNHWADAMYYSTSTFPISWPLGTVNPAPGGGSFLQINDEDVDWGPYSAAHEYSVDYLGEGVAITFRIVDLMDENSENNMCHLDVEITGPAGYTPGFWKHNIGVALGLNPGKYSAFNDGTKLTLAMLQGYAATVGVTLQEAYEALTARGNTAGQAQIRADMANAFNAAAGYGPFED